LVAGVVLAGAMAVVFARALRLPFVADDYRYLDVVQHDGWWHSNSIWRIASTPFRPILFLWFGALHGVFGLHPVPYHVVSAILVLVAALMTALVARRLGLQFGAYIAAAVFCLHASMSTVIGWASASNSALGCALAVAAVYCMVRPRVRAVDAVAAILLFSLALLTREVVVVLPAIVLLARLLIDASTGWKARLTHAALVSAPVWLVAVAYAIVRYVAGAHLDEGAYAQRLSLHGFPNLYRLAAFATDTNLANSTQRGVLVAAFWIVAAGLCVLAYVRSARWQGLFGLGWALIAVLPVIFLASHVMETYYIDFALPGLAIAAGAVFEWASDAVSERARTVGALAVVIVLVLVGFSTARRNERTPLDAEIRKTARLVDQLKRDHPNPEKRATITVPVSGASETYLYANGSLLRVLYNDTSLRVKFIIADPVRP
jgi:4-amino-4-deoxy-L-arabinose transferase-like glycosyltransferase